MKKTGFKTGAMLGTAFLALALASQPALAKKKKNKERDAEVVEATIDSVESVESFEVFDSGESVESIESIESVESVETLKIAPVSGSEERTLDPLGGRIRIFEGDVDSMGGRIRIFEEDLKPLGGRIRIFEDDIDPFKGNIRIFWGDLAPEGGELDPKAGRIRIFSDSFFAQATTILAAWDGYDQAAFEAEVQKLFDDGKSQWRGQIREQTGKGWKGGFANAFFAKWGVDPDDLSDMQEWDAWKRQAFLIDWHDNLLNFSGMDQVDHWMNAVNWNPRLTQIQSGGSKSTIGLIDFFVAETADISEKVVYSGGYDTVDAMHGAAVGSLIAAPHDGVGVMGIAPNSKIAAYNPFDETYTASWQDVTRGIQAVREHSADVINLSLGVKGRTLPAEWRDVFVAAPDTTLNNALFVIAAGNDGTTQTNDIEFGGAFGANFLVVGSVDSTGQISGFSNRPGTACLLNKSVCENDKAFDPSDPNFAKGAYLNRSGLLMNHFLVAPGELILTSDGKGGVTRVSGTSFAAPLVSGAAALIQDRWPWLRLHPEDVARAILESATDLGAPGVDPVYGHGLLNIEAAQSALDFNNLTYYLKDANENWSMGERISATTLREQGFQASWDNGSMYFTATEELVNSFRDFTIPLSTRMFDSAIWGQSVQEYMYDGFMTWLGSGDGGKSAGFRDMHQTAALPLGDGWTYSFSGRQNTVVGDRFLVRPDLETAVQVNAPDNSFGFSFGIGDGSAIIGGQRNLGLTTDYNPATGGANPLLGFASGGMHMSVNTQIAEGLNVSFATSQRDGANEERIALEDFGFQDRALIEDRGNYEAMSSTLRLDYDLSGASRLSLAYTMLDERDALFGVRSLEPTDFGNGVRTSGMTLAADFDLGAGINLFGSATASTSNSAANAAFQVRDDLSSAFQIGASKQGIFGKKDRLRMTVAQPLTLERGAIEFEQFGVIDRETGELGEVTERFDISNTQGRRFVAEGYYAAPMMNGQAEVSLFGRAELRPGANFSQETSDYLGGVKFRVAF